MTSLECVKKPVMEHEFNQEMALQRKDKIIVFSDNIFALREYAVLMRKPMIYGGTSHQERTRVLSKFKHSSDVLPCPGPPMESSLS